jgi:hypothetical protein
MECKNQDFIITVAVMTLGVIINLNLTPDIQSLFQNVRFFSKAGDYELSHSSQIHDIMVLPNLYNYFRKNLNTNTLQTIYEYIDKVKLPYQQLLNQLDNQQNNNENNTEKNKNVCRVFENITIDKIFTEKKRKWFGDDIFSELSGIFLVSIHKKNHENLYELIWPSNLNQQKNININLLDMYNIKRLYELFYSSDIQNINVNIDNLYNISQNFDYDDYIKRINYIQNSKKYSEQEKQQLIDKEFSNFFNYAQDFKIDIENNYIYAIKMSTFVHILKNIFGNNCSINLLDFSCNHISKTVPEEQIIFSKYMTPSDIENPPSSWGGKYIKKNNKKKNNRTKRQRSFIRKNYKRKTNKTNKKYKKR